VKCKNKTKQNKTKQHIAIYLCESVNSNESKAVKRVA
jgi:hypothetical protein